MRFENQTVVVTGASRGIGREIALSFGREGAKVVCVATTLGGAQSTADLIGETARAYACDVGNVTSVEQLFESIGAEMGVPSVVVNNAGITRDALLVRMKDDDWDRVIEVNLKGAFLCIRAVTRAMMKARYGRIINIGSVIGLTGAAGQANYAAAKAGLSGLTKSVAKELGGRGITCNMVAPGFIETDMTDSLSAEMREEVVKMAPAARLGTPTDIAQAVLFLADRNAGYITGQTLTIDGGLTL